MAQQQLEIGYHDESSPAPPAFNKNKITIIGHRICPFVRRALLTLDIKGIEYDFIGINLQRKPKWYLQLHPTGKVPFLQQGDKQVWESLVIVNYLDDIKGPSIHPSGPYSKARGQLLLDEVFPHIFTVVKVIKSPEMTNEQRFTLIKNSLGELEKILGETKDKYLQGPKPHYVDYMVWPFLEMMAPFVEILSKDTVDGDEYIASNYPSVGKFVKAMKEDASVQKVSLKKEITREFYRHRFVNPK